MTLGTVVGSAKLSNGSEDIPWGSVVRVRGEFYNSLGALANPTTQTLTLIAPDGTSLQYTSPTNLSTGIYYVDLQVSQSGRWAYQWVGTGTVEAYGEFDFKVNKTQFSPDPGGLPQTPGTDGKIAYWSAGTIVAAAGLTVIDSGRGFTVKDESSGSDVVGLDAEGGILYIGGSNAINPPAALSVGIWFGTAGQFTAGDSAADYFTVSPTSASFAVPLSLTGSGYLAIGADPADTGAVRLGNGASNGIYFEASPAGTDVGIYLDASEVLQLGTSASLLKAGASIALAGTVAASGDLRVAHGFTQAGRNQANSADASLMRWGATSNNRLVCGDDSQVVDIDYRTASGNHRWYVGNRLGAELFDGGAASTTTMVVGGAKSTGDAVVEVGKARSGDGNSYIQFVSTTGSPTYNLRLIRESGVNGNMALRNTGTGSINIINEGAGALNLSTTNTVRWVVEAGGVLRPNGAMDLGSTGSPVQSGYFSGAVIIGTNPAIAGAVRLATGSGGEIRWRNAANSADLIGLASSSGTNFLVVGQNSGWAGIFYDTPTSTNHTFAVNTVNQLVLSASVADFQDNEIRTTGFIALGSDPADTGGVRLSNGSSSGIWGEASAAGTDVLALHVNATEDVVLGGSGNNSVVLLDSAGSPKLIINTTGVGFNGQAPVARFDYTVNTPGTPTRTLTGEGGAETLANVVNVVNQIIDDLITVGIFQ